MNLHLLHNKHKLLAILALLGLVIAILGANTTKTGQAKLRFSNEKGEEVVLDTKEFEESSYKEVLIGDLGDLQIKNRSHQWNQEANAFEVAFDVYNIPQANVEKAVDLSIDHFTVDLHASVKNGKDSINYIKKIESQDTRWIEPGKSIRIVTRMTTDKNLSKILTKEAYTLQSLVIHIDTKNTTPEWDEYNNITQK